MTTDVTLTSYILNPWDGTETPADSDLIVLSYANLDYVPSASDSYQSTSGDIFKVYVAGERIYRASDNVYASGSGFLESGDVASSSSATTLNGLSLISGSAVTWASTADNVWTIDTTNQRVTINVSNIAATALYGASGKAVSFTTDTTIIELKRAVQDLSTPAVDFSNASILTEQDLDNSAKNIFHVAQQAVISTDNAMLYESGTDTYQSFQPGTTTSKRISGVATPTGANDAANKTYVDGSSFAVTVAGIADDITSVAGVSTEIDTIVNKYDGTTAASGTNKNIVQIDAVADNTANINTVAGKVTEIGRIGTSDMAASIALIGTTGYAHASTGDIKLVADIAANVTKVADIDSEVTAVAGLGTDGVDVTTVSNIGTDGADVTTVAGKATEIGRLGTVDAVADMALLGTTAAIANMALLGTADVTDDMADLSPIVAEITRLGTTDAVGDMNTLGTGTNVTNMGTVAGVAPNVTTVAGISGNVTTVAGANTSIATIATGYDGTTALSGTLTNLANINTVSTNIGTISAKVGKSGDTMTGLLTLSGDPASTNHAATKGYVDSQASGNSVIMAIALG